MLEESVVNLFKEVSIKKASLLPLLWTSHQLGVAGGLVLVLLLLLLLLLRGHGPLPLDAAGFARLCHRG